jgi:hypothetical protein
MKNIKFILTSMLGLVMFYLCDAATVPHGRFGAPNPPRLWPYPGVRQSLLSLAPNDLYQVSVEYGGGFWGSDKGITLWLKTEEEAKLISKVGIQGDVGSERIVWSKDGNQFLLTGRHFIKPIPELPNYAINQLRETIYLLYDVKSHKIYCHEGVFNSNICLPLTKDLIQKFE